MSVSRLDKTKSDKRLASGAMWQVYIAATLFIGVVVPVVFSTVPPIFRSLLFLCSIIPGWYSAQFMSVSFSASFCRSPSGIANHSSFMSDLCFAIRLAYLYSIPVDASGRRIINICER